MDATADYVLDMRGVLLRSGGAHALTDVGFGAREGELFSITATPRRIARQRGRQGRAIFAAATTNERTFPEPQELQAPQAPAMSFHSRHRLSSRARARTNAYRASTTGSCHG